MKTPPESVSTVTRTIRDEFRIGNPRRLRSIHDEWIRSALAVHSASTR